MEMIIRSSAAQQQLLASAICVTPAPAKRLYIEPAIQSSFHAYCKGINCSSGAAADGDVGNHPAYEAVKAACDAWMLRVAQPKSLAFEEFLTDATNLSSLCCMALPAYVQQKRLIRVSKMLAWLTLADDMFDAPLSGSDSTTHHRYQQQILSVFSPEAASGAPRRPSSCSLVYADDEDGERMLGALSELWQEMSTDIPLALQSRLAQAVKAAMDANSAQAVYLKDARRLPSTLQEFLTYRRPSSLYPLGLLLVEYALDLQLDQATLRHPLVQQLLTAVVDYCSWCNDFFSFQVEISRAEYFSLPCLVFCYAITDSSPPVYAYHTLQDAVHEVVRMINAADSLCVSLCENIQASGMFRKQPSLSAFVSALGTWNSAVLKWYAESPRYRRSFPALE